MMSANEFLSRNRLAKAVSEIQSCSGCFPRRYSSSRATPMIVVGRNQNSIGLILPGACPEPFEGINSACARRIDNARIADLLQNFKSRLSALGFLAAVAL